jgi:dihydrofolate reductase
MHDDEWTKRLLMRRENELEPCKSDRRMTMGRVVVSEFITLDGVIETPGGGEPFEHAGWSFEFDRGEEGDRFKLDELMASEAQLLGRITYEGFAKAWPSMTDMGEFGEKMNAMAKYVVSSTLTADEADWNNSTVINDDLPGRISQLKQRVRGDILVAGSAQLVRSLAQHGLVDEYRLMVFPIVLGNGKRLFGDGSPRMRLGLLDSKPLGTDGVFLHTYTPAEVSG